MTRVAVRVLIALATTGAAFSATGTPFVFPPPGERASDQPRATAAEAGLDPKLIAELGGIASRWALWRYGRLIHVEGDFNQSGDVHSNRKTWHALAVGAAIQQRRIPSQQQKISVWNPELKGRHANATWRHVITQTSGFDYPYGDMPAFDPGAMWTYSDANAVNLCNAIARVWGKRDHRGGYEEVMRQAYFDAIGMRGWRTGYSPEDDGIRFIFDLEDMGRLGLLVCARGNWNGRQIVGESFVRELETKQTRGARVNYAGPNDGRLSLDAKEFPEAPYGYMTWVNTDGDLWPGADRNWASARGKYGHLTLWNHSLGIVFAAAGWHAESRRHDVPQIVERNLRPATGAWAAAPAATAATARTPAGVPGSRSPSRRPAR